MTDTFILQLPDFDSNNKIYYIPQHKHSLDQLSTEYYANDDEDEDDSFNINNNYNNLFADIDNNYIYNNNLTAEEELNFPFSPSYIQEIEYDYTTPVTYQNKIVTNLKPSINKNNNNNNNNNNNDEIPLQSVIVPKPKHQLDSYCPLLHNDNISYEEYLKSNAFNSMGDTNQPININNINNNNNNNINTSTNNNNNNLYSYTKKPGLSSSSSSSFSTYSSLFSNNNNIKVVRNDHTDSILENVNDNDESMDSPDSDLDDIILLPNAKHKKTSNIETNSVYFPLDFQFITIIENKLNRYASNNQEVIDKIRLQEVSYRFSKTYV